MPLPAIGAVVGLLSPRLWKILGVVVAVSLLIWFISHRISEYGDAREADGVAKEKAAWVEADRKLQERVVEAKTKADASAAIRQIKHDAEVIAERKEIDEAVAEGRSPLDVLFGS